MTFRALIPGCLLTLAAVLSACSAPKQHLDSAIEIPAQYVSDTLVIPPELQAEYSSITSDEEYDYYKMDAADVRALPLSRRRALAYYDTFSYETPPYEMYLKTFPAPEGYYDSLIQEIQSRLGFKLEYSFYEPLTSSYQPGVTEYTLTSRRALSTGEVGWLMDWLITHYGDSVKYAEASGYSDIVNP